MSAPAIVEMLGLRVQLPSGAPILEGVDLRLEPGQIVGLVGESGSGKTTTALAMLGYNQAHAKIAYEQMNVTGQRVGVAADLRGVRGRVIAYVPQNPGTALNPSMRIGEAIEDMIKAHRPDRLQTGVVEELLTTVGLPATSEFARRFPHQLSGGQQQRACIAIALAAHPAALVLDEPTTGLDVITQAHILSQLRRLRAEQHVSMLYVTHDLAVVAEIADRIAVMYAGRIVEEGPASEVLGRPRHPYTRGLLSSIPDHTRPQALQPMAGIAVGVGERPAGCAFAPRCPQRVAHCEEQMPTLEVVDSTVQRARCFEWRRTPPLADPLALAAATANTGGEVENVLEVKDLRAEYRSRAGAVVAADGVSFTVKRGSCVALVGESGSGKTTIARVIAGLHPPTSGEILLCGEALAGLARRRTRSQRQRLQIVFQNPTDALNPRHDVRRAVARPIHALRGLGRKEAEAEVERLLECVRLPARFASRYPHELSGGERQRVALARALAAEPELIVCDEITSALDVSVQAAVLSLLEDLRADLGLSLVFITHDLGVVATIADEVLVLERGIACERGPVAKLLTSPSHPYTSRLLQAAPSLARAGATEASAVDQPPAASLMSAE